MKNELKLKSQLPDLRSEAQELLSTEMFEIKGGLATSDCSSCSAGCSVSCAPGCAVCTGCVTGSWII